MNLNTHKEREKWYERVKSLVEEMRARYPEECGIEALEPALTDDIAEIAMKIHEQTLKQIDSKENVNYVVLTCFLKWVDGEQL